MLYAVLVVGLFGLMSAVFSARTYDVPGLVIVGMVLAIGVGVFLIPRLARGEDQGFLLNLLYLGFAAKMLGSLARLGMSLAVYGFRDVTVYNRAGTETAIQLYRLDFGAIVKNLGVGTEFTGFYTGVVYAIFGPTKYGAFLVFGALSFLGSYYFYKAFRLAFPEARHRLYGFLVFLYPTVLYWPNGIGKDAMMALFIGLSAYGCAVLLMRSKFSGLIPLGIGLAGCVTVRPHVAGMVVIGLLLAFLLRRSVSDPSARAVKFAVLAGGLVLALVATPALLDYVGLRSLSVEATQEYFVGEEGVGGSAFTSPSLTSPWFFPTAVVTVLFRPFLFIEAHNVQAMIQALDGLLLAGILAWRFPSLVQAARSFRSSPYIVLIVVYLALLMAGLMVVANFGTLARERSMVIPMLLMLVALPSRKEVGQRQAAVAEEGT
jgi:hypothetical protein